MTTDILDIAKNNKWFKTGKWKEPGFLQNIIISGYLEENDISLNYHPNIVIFSEFMQFILESEYNQIINNIILDIEKNPNQILSEINKEVEMAIIQTDSFNPAKLDKDAIQEYVELIKVLGRQSLRFILLGYALEIIYPKSLPEKFTINNEEYDAQKLLALVALPKKIAPMIAERKNILEIACLLDQNKDVSEQLKEHAKEYGWMNSLCWWDEPFTAEHYRIEVEKYKGQNPKKMLEELEEKRKIQYESAEKILEIVEKDYPTAFCYINMIREMADLREESWDASSRAGVRMRPLFKDLAKNYGFNYNELLMLNIEELIDLIESKEMKVSKEEINQRLDAFAIVCGEKGQKLKVYSGETSKNLSKYCEGKIANSTVLSGLTIWPGKITAKARVLNSINDIKKIKPGEVLVCPMTDPDFMPAIYKACALVTDQGGVLCHAAIIARELQKPCVVGTKTATRTIKSGDTVEVDADNGVINIID